MQFSFSTDDIPQTSDDGSGFFKQYYAGASECYGNARTFIDEFDEDKFATFRKDNLYYPFASRSDWEVGSFLHSCGLSMASVDAFLSLDFVSTLLLIFKTNISA